MAARMFGMAKRSWSLLAPGVQRLMEQYHISGTDLPAMLNQAHAAGIDPITALEQWFEKTLALVKSPTDRAEIIGAFLHNQGAQQAMVALLEHTQEQERIRALLAGTKPGQIQTDFNTAMGLPEVDVKNLTEELSQLERTIGAGLTPVLHDLNNLLIPVVSALGGAASIAGFGVQTGLAAGIGKALLGMSVADAAGVAPLAVGDLYLAQYDMKALAANSKANADALDRNTAALNGTGGKLGSALHVGADGKQYVVGPGGVGQVPRFGPVNTPGFHGPDQTLGRP
jgi:hypothetical protein